MSIALQTSPSQRGTLSRTTLATSRLLDFASKKELTAQTGHEPGAWPLVILKELTDNSLDACEEAGIAPEITVTVDASRITVADNGPGLPVETIKGTLDYAVRVSSREAYVSPTRGAQGNALKTLLAMPFVLDGEHGRVEVEVGGTRHIGSFRVDRIRQEPVVNLTQESSDVRNGTVVGVMWPHSACSILTSAKQHFLQIASDYAWLNPHLTMMVDWFGQQMTLGATSLAWTKWKPSDPTSAHWYTAAHLERLIAGYVSHDAARGQERTVRELVAEFRGLTGTAKQKLVLDETGLSRAPLSQLIGDRAIDREIVSALLTAMQAASKPVKPDMLGIIGKEHLHKRFAEAGCEMESFEYRRSMEIEDGVPWIIEAAFGWCPDASARCLVTGVNWSPGIVNPFRELGRFGKSLDTILSQQHVEQDDPVILFLHLACPRVEYTDRGKSAVVTTGAKANAIIDAVQGVTKKWAKQRKAEKREHSAILRRRAALMRCRAVTIKEAAWRVMETAFMKASAGGTLPANARQIMYAARPAIQEMTGQRLNDQYFIQTLLPDYMEEKGVTWDVIFDARGRLTEPHTKEEVQLGTLHVREYLTAVERHHVGRLSFNVSRFGYPTRGPKHRYGAILFVEKEGFEPLFRAVKLAQRYDIAIMSTKGMSVTASRELVQALCAEYDIPLLVLHDFDVSGFSIFGTLSKDTRRFKFSKEFKIIDLGLRLADIHGLETEDVHISSPEKTRKTLHKHGATDEEIRFLLHRRVELNAFASGELIAWIECKLEEHGVVKIVPDDATLAAAYRRMRQQAEVQARIDEVLASFEHDQAILVPDNLHARLTRKLEEGRSISWDTALLQIVSADGKEDA